MVSSNPEITVLIPTYNSARYLEESIKSVLDQTFTDFEVIIIDDGSSDNTSLILSLFSNQDARIRILRNTDRKGISASLNLGLVNARGSLIARLDADDRALPTRLDLQRRAFIEDDELVLCGTNAIYVTEDCKPLFPTALPLDDWSIRSITVLENPFRHSTVMMRAHAVNAAGGYLGEYKTAQDYELWVRLMQEGRVRNLPQYLGKLRIHSGSVSSTQSVSQIENRVQIQLGYARDFIGDSTWEAESFFMIGQQLFISHQKISSISGNPTLGIETSLEIIAAVDKRYPNKNNNYFKRYVLGRCLLSVIVSPPRWKKLLKLLSTLIRYPIASVESLGWLVKMSWKYCIIQMTRVFL